MTTELESRTSSLITLASGQGRATAIVSTRAASLRTLTVGGTALVEPTAGTEQPSGMAGAVLVPWPNRVEDAVWWYEGEQQRLTITEPQMGNAIHGLLADTDYEIITCQDDCVQLRTILEPQPGYPFRLGVAVRYVIDDHGLQSRIEITNYAEEPAPVAVGVHPYVCIGDVPLDTLRVTLDADWLWTLDQRYLPVMAWDVQGTRQDPGTPHLVQAAPSHAVYHRSTPHPRGQVHRLQAPDGRTVDLWADRGLPWTQWYVAPDLLTDRGPRRALAIEPMSAPPNALRTGLGLCFLACGMTRSWEWGLTLRQATSRAR